MQNNIRLSQPTTFMTISWREPNTKVISARNAVLTGDPVRPMTRQVGMGMPQVRQPGHKLKLNVSAGPAGYIGTQFWNQEGPRR